MLNKVFVEFSVSTPKFFFNFSSIESFTSKKDLLKEPLSEGFICTFPEERCCLLEDLKEFNCKPHKDNSGFKVSLLIEFCCKVLNGNVKLVEVVVKGVNL